jgi:hypothetical protein
MPDSTCRYPQKSHNSSCFNEDVCHFHPPGTDPTKFYCDTEPSDKGVCRTTQNDSLCKGWCTNSSTANAECRPQFPLLNTSFLPVGLTFSCVGHSCGAYFSFLFIGNGAGAGQPLDCSFTYNTTDENTTISSNQTEYIDHCIQGLLLGGGYGGQYIGCSYRYKCAEPIFTISSVASAAAVVSEDALVVCAPVDPSNPRNAYDEIDAVSFFGSLRKTPTPAQYAQMVAEYHMSVWGHPECPGARRRAVHNAP